MNKTSLQIILNHFGRMNQILKLVEEMSELARAIVKAIMLFGLDAEKILAHEPVLQELADVIILLKQLGLTAELAEALTAEAEIRTARTIDRIGSGYYEANHE